MKAVVYRILVPILMSVMISGCAPMPWKVPNKGFLSFDDAAPCMDFGDISNLDFDSVSVFQLPFLCATKFEDRIEKKAYPVTEGRIDSFITANLRPRFRLFEMNDVEAPEGSGVNEFIETVLANAASGRLIPLDWGHEFPPDVIGNRTIIYFPFGIERESGDYVRARFYVLIFSPDGSVMFSRCMPYQPEDWSTRIDSFFSDVEGKLPLLER